MQRRTTTAGARCAAIPALIGILAVGSVLFAGPAAADAPTPMEAATQAALRPAPEPAEAGDAAARGLPRVLDESDAALYREIFELQSKARWKEADKKIAALNSPLLLGHVQFQRLMHPTGYRSRFTELRDWLKDYRDHPEADRVYALSLTRRPSNYAYPAKPFRASIPMARRADFDNPEFVKLSAAQRRQILKSQRHVRRLVGRGSPTNALEYLESGRIKPHFDAISFDESLGVIARGYYHAELDEKALAVAERATKRSGPYVADAHWWAGLAAFRLGEFERAAGHFAAMTEGKSVSGWLRASGGFWAARSYLQARKPAMVNRYFNIAAEHPRTFYGLLALHALGRSAVYDWRVPVLDADGLDRIKLVPPAHRALALLQIGEEGLAAAELAQAAGLADPETARIIAAICEAANFTELAFRIGRSLDSRGITLDTALYPIPRWQPAEGFTVDRALIYGVMRQESQFKTDAKSYAGARGLMQLMPGTAGFMAGTRFRGHGRNKLFDPELNVALGQRYVEHLLDLPEIGGNLFYTAAAYNGGPGNLQKWRKASDYREDSLLFIESNPARETRIYVERVLANMWIYRHRFGQPTPALTAIAAGGWPTYTPLDPGSEEIADRGN